MSTRAEPQQQVHHDGPPGAPPPGGVVVGYDGSASAEPALTWAAEEVARRGGTLTVLCAGERHQSLATVLRAGHPAPAAGHARDAARRTADRGVEHVHRSGRLPAGVDVHAEVRHSGAATALVEASERADLLVLGNRGRGALAGAVLGSVAFSVTARASCPVVVVRGDVRRAPGPDAPVVVGVDGSGGARHAVGFAAAAAVRAGAPLVVVAAWNCPALVVDGYPTVYDVRLLEQQCGRAREAAEEAAREAREQALAVAPDLRVRTSVAEQVAGTALVAAAAGAGLLVVGARGHGAVSGLFLGSVSHAAIHRAPCPVAVVRPQAG